MFPHYALYGTLASRLALSIQGTCFAWGFEGPWATTGGAPTDLETFLDLERPAPDDLPPASLARLAFAHYIPRDRVIEWHWSDRIYCLHLERSGPRWSYRTRAVGAMSGALLYSAGGAVIDDPTTVAIGSPTINSIDQEGAYSTLTWANGFASGGEVLEVWLRTGSQSWRREEGDARVTLESVQTHNILDLSDIPPGIHEYDVAIRYRLQGRYAPEYRERRPGPMAREVTIGVHHHQ